MGAFEIREGNEEFLDTLQPLWEKLNEHHRKISDHFSSEFAGRSFAQRKEVLTGKAAAGQLKIYMAIDSTTTSEAGYCIATISEDNLGEIDSIFVADEYRKQGIGDLLLRTALDWMDTQSVEDKVISVAFGNDSALDFYRRYGFLPRLVVLKQI